MGLDDSVPEEYFDILVQEFAYDPVRLPSTEDSSEMLYNRRTLEKIWDTNHNAVSPYTRQPFQISNVIPQNQLKQQMLDYIERNRELSLRVGVEVIPDYTQVLDETDMKHLLNELVLAGNRCLLFLKNKCVDRKLPDDEELKHWKSLWKKLNLVRLYCQYSAQNRETFSSIRGYDYLFQVVTKRLQYACSTSSCDDAMEIQKEVARIVDVMGGLQESDLRTAPKSSVWALVGILLDLVSSESQYLKIQSMVLRIYRGMFEHCIDYLMTSDENSCCFIAQMAFDLLTERFENQKDIVNEEIYNATAILQTAWVNNIDVFTYPHDYMEVPVAVVINCIFRLEELHYAAAAHLHEEEAMISSSQYSSEEVENNINLNSMALEQGLFLIHSPLTTAAAGYAGEGVEDRLEIVRAIVRMVELIVLRGINLFHSSHLLLGFNIIAQLATEDGGRNAMTRMKFVHEVFQVFLGSNLVDEYGTEVKLLLQHIVGRLAPEEEAI